MHATLALTISRLYCTPDDLQKKIIVVNGLRIKRPFTSPPGEANSCDAHVRLSVCLFVCLCVRSHNSNVAETRFFSGGVAICHVFPVLWMT